MSLFKKWTNQKILSIFPVNIFIVMKSTAWKVTVFSVILVRITPNTDTFSQCLYQAPKIRFKGNKKEFQTIAENITIMTSMSFSCLHDLSQINLTKCFIVFLYWRWIQFYRLGFMSFFEVCFFWQVNPNKNEIALCIINQILF